MEEKKYSYKVKELLKEYGADRKTIYAKENAIKEINSQLDMLQAGWSSSEPTQGGGTSQEDKVIKLLDRKKILENEVNQLRADNFELRYALRQLDTTSKMIIFNVWIDQTYSIRQQARKLYLAKSTVYDKSELAIKVISKLMVEQGYKFKD